MESVNENDEEENSVTKSSVSQSEQMQRLKSVGLELRPINQQIKSRWFLFSVWFHWTSQYLMHRLWSDSTIDLLKLQSWPDFRCLNFCFAFNICFLTTVH